VTYFLRQLLKVFDEVFTSGAQNDGALVEYHKAKLGFFT
jgi:hypothetical protein